MTETARPELLAGSRSVVIVMLSAIGDAVHVLPVANALRAQRPDLSITWVIQPVPHQLVATHAAIDQFVLFHRTRGKSMWGEVSRTSRVLRETSFDLALGLQVYLKAGILLGRSGARIRLGFDRRRARDLQWLFSTHRIPPGPNRHVQDQYFEFLDYLGVWHDEPEWGLLLSDTEETSRRDYFAKFTRPVCGLVVGTSNPAKNWSVDRYARLIDALDTDLGMGAVLLGGPSQAERQVTSEILAHCAKKPKVELVDHVRRLLWLLWGCDVVVSPDTGPLHIARAIDVPVVGLYGFTNPKRTGPYKKFVELVVDGYAQSPGEDYPISALTRPAGMSRISVDGVLAKVELARQRYPQGRTSASGSAN